MTYFLTGAYGCVFFVLHLIPFCFTLVTSLIYFLVQGGSQTNVDLVVRAVIWQSCIGSWYCGVRVARTSCRTKHCVREGPIKW